MNTDDTVKAKTAKLTALCGLLAALVRALKSVYGRT